MKKKEFEKISKEYKEIRKQIEEAGKQHKQITRLLKEHDEMMKEINNEFKLWAQKLEAVIPAEGPSQLAEATKMLRELQLSFNTQLLQIQIQMQNANNQFTAVSNIMKIKHDTAKNSISNIR